MKKIFMTKSALFLSICLVGAISCQKSVELPSEGEYGNSVSVTLPSEKGSTEISVKSDGNWFASLTPLTGEWAAIEGAVSGNGDGKVTVSFKENNGLLRKGALLVSSETKVTVDTVYLKQYGIVPFCKLMEDKLDFTSVASSSDVSMDTNIPASNIDKFSYDVSYSQELAAEKEGWVSVAFSEDLRKVIVSVSENIRFESRNAVLTISYKNEWGEISESSIDICQAMPGGTQNTEVRTFEEIRALISEPSGEKLIEEDIAIEGWIVSDRNGLNMGDCPNTDNTHVDLTPNMTTAYMESADGSLGFRLMTASEDTYLMERYDFSKVWLKGLTLVKEDNPVRYTIKGISNEHYISVKSGTEADIPVKTRYINTLKDEDIYTYVTLKKVEMPCRRGGLLPVNQGYRERFTKYPSLVADIHGDWIYMFTNHFLFDLNPKEEVPFGQGRISGILVHEEYSRFEKDGDIGRYQIRYCRYDDINISRSANDSYSKAIVEWTNQVNDKSAASEHKVARLHPKDIIGEDIPGINWALRPAYGWGLAYNEPKGAWPAVSGNFTDPAKMSTTSSTSWGFTPSWDAVKGYANGCTFLFSTKDINTDLLTFVMTARYHKSFNVPPYFVLEASADEGKTWVKVRDFTIPPIVDWGATQMFQMPSDKSFYFVLPKELLGLDRAMIRMSCPNNKASDKTSIDGSTFTGSAGGAFLISYAAVRYKN